MRGLDKTLLSDDLVMRNSSYYLHSQRIIAFELHCSQKTTEKTTTVSHNAGLDEMFPFQNTQEVIKRLEDESHHKSSKGCIRGPFSSCFFKLSGDENNIEYHQLCPLELCIAL